MGHVLQLLFWIGIVSQVLLSVRLVGEGAQYWGLAFQKDYHREVCGRFQAMEANLRDALTVWRKAGCGSGNDEAAVDAIERELLEWRHSYRDVDLEVCESLRLHRERNPSLEEDYPNWVVRYE